MTMGVCSRHKWAGSQMLMGKGGPPISWFTPPAITLELLQLHEPTTSSCALLPFHCQLDTLKGIDLKATQ